MAGILSWLFGGGKSKAKPAIRRVPEPDEDPAPERGLEASRARHASDWAEAEAATSHITGDPSVDYAVPGKAYFNQLEKLTAAISAQDYHAAAAAAKASFPPLRRWLKDPRADGHRIPVAILALGQGCTAMAIVGDEGGLKAARKIVYEFEYLKDYRESVEEHVEDLGLCDRIRSIVRENPGILQTSMKTELGIENGRRSSNLIAYLAKHGDIRRVKSGRSYQLYSAR